MRLPITTVHSYSDAVRAVRGVFYGWWLVGIAVFMLTVMAVGVFQGLGTFLVAMQREFGWSRTVLSGAFALARAQGAVIGPVEGFLIDKMGNRRMILIGYTLMACGFYLFSQVHSVWQFYLAFITITLGFWSWRMARRYVHDQQLVRSPPRGHTWSPSAYSASSTFWVPS